MKYTAASLEDIAKAFEQAGAKCTASAERKHNIRDAMMCRREASVWQTAAEFLRNTTLTGEA